MNIIKKLILLAIILTLGACSFPAPKYTPSYDNVQMIKNTKASVEVTDFKGKDSSLGSISLRGSSLTSPYGKDLIHYLQVALESEFEKAGILKKPSNTRLTAIIEENDIDAAISVATGIIKAKFIVSKNGTTVYKKSISITSEWESSFMGAIAIPKAVESYPMLAKKLLKKLYSDKNFINSLK